MTWLPWLSGEWMLSAALRVTVLLAALLLAWRGLPASQPRLRRAMALAGALATLAMLLPASLWEVTLPFNPTASTMWPGGDRMDDASLAERAKEFPWARVLAVAWFAGFVIAAGRWSVQAWRLHRVMRSAPSFRQAAMRHIAGQAGRASDAFDTFDAAGEFAAFHDVRLSSALRGPCVAGSWRPVLLVPSSARGWTAEEWLMVLAHERQHLHQRDLLAGWLLRAVAAVYWWHPLVHWLHRQYHLESEALCDRAVLSPGRSARPYVEFLLALSSRAVPPLAAAMARPSRLGQRLERLLAAPSGTETRRGPSLLAFALVLAALGLAVLRISPETSPPPSLSPIPQPSEGTERAALASEAALRLSADPFPQH